MTVADACVLISFLAGEATPEVEILAALPLNAGATLAPLIDHLETIEIGEGYWARAGKLRASVRRAGRKAALGDALLAQACLDADLPLLTPDGDFRAFTQFSNLRLAY